MLFEVAARRGSTASLDLGTGDGIHARARARRAPGRHGCRPRLPGRDARAGGATASPATRRRRDPQARPGRRRCRPISAGSTSSCRASRSTTCAPERQHGAVRARCSTGSRPGGVFVNVEHVASHHRAAPRGVPRRARRAARRGRPVQQAGAGRDASGLVERMSDSPTWTVFGSGGNLPLFGPPVTHRRPPGTISSTARTGPARGGHDEHASTSSTTWHRATPPVELALDLADVWTARALDDVRRVAHHRRRLGRDGRHPVGRGTPRRS